MGNPSWKPGLSNQFVTLYHRRLLASQSSGVFLDFLVAGIGKVPLDALPAAP
jgi:hypothetical protein